MNRLVTRALPVSAAVVAMTAIGLSVAHAGSQPAADRTAPAPPTITSRPANPTTVNSLSVRFTGEAGARFECRLDNRPFSRCASPANAAQRIAVGAHQFEVRAIDKAGNVGASSSFRWTIKASVTSFRVVGHAAGALRPGTTTPIDVAISNPYAFAIKVKNLVLTPTRTVTDAQGKPMAGCDGSATLKPTQYSGAPIVVAPNGTVTLTDKAIPKAKWPQLTMAEPPSGKNPCKAARFAFTFKATATKA